MYCQKTFLFKIMITIFLMFSVTSSFAMEDEKRIPQKIMHKKAPRLAALASQKAFLRNEAIASHRTDFENIFECTFKESKHKNNKFDLFPLETSANPRIIEKNSSIEFLLTDEYCIILKENLSPFCLYKSPHFDKFIFLHYARVDESFMGEPLNNEINIILDQRKICKNIVINSKPFSIENDTDLINKRIELKKSFDRYIAAIDEMNFDEIWGFYRITFSKNEDAFIHYSEEDSIYMETALKGIYAHWSASINQMNPAKICRLLHAMHSEEQDSLPQHTNGHMMAKDWPTIIMNTVARAAPTTILFFGLIPEGYKLVALLPFSIVLGTELLVDGPPVSVGIAQVTEATKKFISLLSYEKLCEYYQVARVHQTWERGSNWVYGLYESYFPNGHEG